MKIIYLCNDKLKLLKQGYEYSIKEISGKRFIVEYSPYLNRYISNEKLEYGFLDRYNIEYINIIDMKKLVSRLRK